MSVVSSSTTKKRKHLVEEFTINRLHPVQVEFTYPIGARVDMERELPFSLEDADPDEILDMLSSPPEYEDRISPVSCMLNQEKLTALNPADLQTKFLRKLSGCFNRISKEIDIASRAYFGEKGPTSFMGLGLDPQAIIRLIEEDYDTADNVYSRLMRYIEEGYIVPIATTPFHSLLTQFQHDFDIRLLLRIGMEIYWPLLRKYNKAVSKHQGERYFIMPFWLPEGAFNKKILEILHQEFTKRCEQEEITPCHLLILLDSEQSREREQDLLMKRWNTLRPSPTTRDIVTIMFKERTFSDWVVQGHPSTKKQLDRTIAKVDAVSRDKGIDHLWSHFEPLTTLLSTFKTCNNFEQKIVKLTELKYQPCGPDVFARRKLLDKYGMHPEEPRRIQLEENTTWNAYADTPGSMVRFLGYEEEHSGFVSKKILGKNRPFEQVMPDGTRKHRPGSPCWKPALLGALMRVHRAVVGEPKTFMGGMLEVIRELVPIRRIPVVRRNIEDFLVSMSHIAWKEHFIHHVCCEADIQLQEFCLEHLLKDNPTDEDIDLSEEECCIIGMAAHAIYHSHGALNSTALAFENIDNRAVYQDVMMMTLAVSHAIAAYRWNEQHEKAEELFKVFKEELLDFGNAYTRHNIGTEFGVSKEVWDEAIASEVPEESELNIVERAARQLGAKHLRGLGFREEFDRRDTYISNATGHIWSHEVGHLNYEWENEVFCGLPEE